MSSTFKHAIRIAFLAAAGWFALNILFYGRTTEAFIALLFGWGNVLSRNAPSLAINWMGVLSVLIFSAAAWAILASLLNRRRAAIALGGFWMIFVISMASAGLVTKAREVIFSPEPHLVRGERFHLHFGLEATLARIALSDAPNIDEARQILPELHHGSYSEGLEKVSVSMLSVADAPVIVIAPRNPADLAKHGFLVSAEKSAWFYPGEALPEIVTALQKLTNADLDSLVSDHNNLRRKAPGRELRLKR